MTESSEVRRKAAVRATGVRNRVAVARDVRRIRRRHAFLRVPAGSPSRGYALAVSLTDWPYQLKQEGMLLKALELSGYEPVVLTSRAAAGTARRYAAAFGCGRVLVLDDYLDGESPDVRPLLAGPLTVQRLKALEVDGAHVGRQVLSTISRNLRRGSVDLESAEAREWLEQLLPSVLAVREAAERILEDLDPEIVLFNEARYAGYGSVFDVALLRGLNVIQFVSGFADDALVFKRYTLETRRFHARSLGPQAWDEVCAGPWTESMQRELDEQFERRYAGDGALGWQLHGWTRRRDAAELVAELELDPAKKTAVVFSHVLWDANLFYGEDLFEDQGEWLVETVREAAANPSVNWVVRLHPANVWKLERGAQGELDEVRAIRERVGDLPPHVRLLLPESDVSALSLFELADYALTIRGTVGVEAPCFGVPVLTAGTGHYSGRGFTEDSASIDEYRERLRRIAEIPALSAERTELARRHAHALFCRRPIRFTSFRTVAMALERSAHPLALNLEPRVRSREELERADDLRTFAHWALDRSRIDYLAPPCAE